MLLCVPVIVPELVPLIEPVGDSVDDRDACDSVEVGVPDGDAPIDSVCEPDSVTVPLDEELTVPDDVPVDDRDDVADGVEVEVAVVEAVLV